MQVLFLRVCAGCSVVALAVLSWLPAQDMVRSGMLSGPQEHFLAYLISGLLVAAAMPRYRFVHVACFYVLLATVLELGQNFAPGRDAQTFTAFISMSGAVVGEIIARLVTGVWREKYGFPPPLIAPIPATTHSPCQSVSAS
jgi:VanZ family protein